MATYDVRCPRCDGHAAAAMVRDGVRGTYREALWRLRAERITCTHCGFARDVPPESGDDYQLWYRTAVGGETVWAVNRAQLEMLVGWLSGEVDEDALGLADRAQVESLPSWLKQRRLEAAERLRALRD